MAKTARARAQGADSTDEQPAAEERDPLSALLDFDEKQARLLLLEWNPDAGSFDYVQSLDIGEARNLGVLELVRQRFGGGKYRAQVKKSNGVMGPSRTFTIAGEKKPRGVAVAPAPAAGRGDDFLGLGDGELAKLFRQRLLSSLIEDKKPGFGVTEVVALITAVTPLITAFVKREGSGKDAMELATQIAQLIQNGNKGGGGIKDVLESVQSILEIRELAGATGTGDPVAATVAALAPEVIAAIREGRQIDKARGVSAPVNRPALPAPAAPASSGPPSHVEGEATLSDTPAWAAELRTHIPLLLAAAREGKDPRGLAESIHDFLPFPKLKGMLRELVALEDAEAQVLATFPDMQPYQTWLAELIDELRSLFYPQSEEASNAGLDS